MMIYITTNWREFMKDKKQIGRVVSLDSGEISPCRNCPKEKRNPPHCLDGCQAIKEFQARHPVNSFSRRDGSMVCSASLGFAPGCRHIGQNHYSEH